MTLPPSKSDKEFVGVVCDYTYTPKDAGEPISIKVGDEFWLIEKTNTEWWFVQKNESKTRFFIPAKYVKILKRVDDVSVAKTNTLTKPKTVAPKPKPRLSRTSASSTEETTPGVATPSDDHQRRLMTRKSSSGEPMSQAKVADESADVTITSPRLEDEALKQLDSVLEAEDQAMMRQTDAGTYKDTYKRTVEQTDEKTAEQTAKSDVFESADAAKTAAKTTATSPQGEDTIMEKSSPAVAKNVEHHTSSSSSLPCSQPFTVEDDELIYVNLEDYQETVKNHVTATTVSTTTVAADSRAESETSDYRSGDSKGGSRESLELKICDTDTSGTKEHLEKPDLAVPVDSPPRMELPPKPVPVAVTKTPSEYANLEDIRTMSRGPQSHDISDGNPERSPQVDVPSGWTLEEDRGQKTFVNSANGEKWKTVCDNTGKRYYYNSSTNQTVWKLAEAGNSGKGTRATEAEILPPAGGADAEFPSLELLPLKMVQKQGPLSKAKVDDQSKKFKKPSWSQSYAVLVENMVYFYKDQKVTLGSKVKSISSLGKPELILTLDDAMISRSPDEKKKEILVLSLSSGVVYFLHNESEEVLQHWKQSFENNMEAIKTMPVTDSKEIENLPVKPDAVFGSSLAAVCEREKTKIPRFVHSCLAAVEKRGLDVDGIYRISGNMSLVQKLRQMVDQNEFYDLACPSWDVHVITGALKLFFRELSEPVFTFALFEEFLNAYRFTDRTQKIQAYRGVIRKLPPYHAETMKKLFKHLAEVIRHETVNRMQPQALAIVFGPTLLWPESKNKDATLAASMVYQGQVVEFMIVEFKSIFS